jgi:hypothetical protein
VAKKGIRPNSAVIKIPNLLQQQSFIQEEQSQSSENKEPVHP